MNDQGFPEEQIIRILKEQQVGLGAKELCRQHGRTHETFYKRHACALAGIHPEPRRKKLRRPHERVFGDVLDLVAGA